MARREWTREALLGGVREGDRRALARAISLVENRDELAYDLVRELYPETGRATAIGVTGPPGVGKSSLISALVRHVREVEGRSVVTLVTALALDFSTDLGGKAFGILQLLRLGGG